MPTHYLYRCNCCDYEGMRYRNVTRCKCGGTLVRVPTPTRRRRIAAVQHEIWAHWMRYLFSKCDFNHDGAAVIPVNLVTRWERQLNTPYAELSESEQESDLHQADKITEVLGR